MSALDKNAHYATVTKIRTQYGKRLKQADYEELLSKKSVVEATEYLKGNTKYSEALSNIDASTIHRGYLEMILRRNLFERYLEFCKFQQLDRKPFYRFRIVEYEIKSLLHGIMCMNAGSMQSFISSLPAYLVKFASFPVLDLGKATSFSEILAVIRNTPYYQVLKDVPVRQDGLADYSKCELQLRTYYMRWLLNLATKEFKGTARKALTQQIEMQTDLINIINAYRMKCDFHATADELNEAMLPFSGRLSKTKLQELYAAPSTEEFLRVLGDTIYGKQIEELDKCTDSVHFEHELTKLRCNLARRSLVLAEDVAVSLYSMMYLLENEVTNIITIIEGIRYQKDISYIENLLVIQ